MKKNIALIFLMLIMFSCKKDEPAIKSMDLNRPELISATEINQTFTVGATSSVYNATDNTGVWYYSVTLDKTGKPIDLKMPTGAPYTSCMQALYNQCRSQFTCMLGCSAIFPACLAGWGLKCAVFPKTVIHFTQRTVLIDKPIVLTPIDKVP